MIPVAPQDPARRSSVAGLRRHPWIRAFTNKPKAEFSPLQRISSIKLSRQPSHLPGTAVEATANGSLQRAGSCPMTMTPPNNLLISDMVNSLMDGSSSTQPGPQNSASNHTNGIFVSLSTPMQSDSNFSKDQPAPMLPTEGNVVVGPLTSPIPPYKTLDEEAASHSPSRKPKNLTSLQVEGLGTELSLENPELSSNLSTPNAQSPLSELKRNSTSKGPCSPLASHPINPRGPRRSLLRSAPLVPTCNHSTQPRDTLQMSPQSSPTSPFTNGLQLPQLDGARQTKSSKEGSSPTSLLVDVPCSPPPSLSPSSSGVEGHQTSVQPGISSRSLGRPHLALGRHLSSGGWMVATGSSGRQKGSLGIARAMSFRDAVTSLSPSPALSQVSSATSLSGLSTRCVAYWLSSNNFEATDMATSNPIDSDLTNSRLK